LIDLVKGGSRTDYRPLWYNKDMPNYDYECETPNCDAEGILVTINCKMHERDTQFCAYCGNKRKRLISFNGLVWAPTAGGMR